MKHRAATASSSAPPLALTNGAEDSSDNESSHDVNRDSHNQSLPKGWKRRESKSQPGKFYYVSPENVTQWIRPSSASITDFAVKIEVKFGPGRLGVGLREYKPPRESVGGTTLPPPHDYPEYQAEVEDLPKLPNGQAGPAEIHNWSVKPDKRIYAGMRLVALDDTSVAGFSYNQVVEAIKKRKRPLVIHFVSIKAGLKSEEPKPASKPIHRKSASEDYDTLYQMILVKSELRNEASKIENQKVFDSKRKVQIKVEVLTEEFNKLKSIYDDLRRKNKSLRREKEKLLKFRETLARQAAGEIESAEVKRSLELESRSTELNNDISVLTAGNAKLKDKLRKLRKKESAVLASSKNNNNAVATAEQLLKITSFTPDDVDVFLKAGDHDSNVVMLQDKLDFVLSEIEREKRKTISISNETASLENDNIIVPDVKARATPPKAAEVVVRQKKVLLNMEGKLDKCPTITSARGGLLNNVKSMRGARERWVVLTQDGIFSYYKRKGDSIPRGHVDLRTEGLEIHVEMEKKKRRHRGKELSSFVMSLPSCQMKFVTNTSSDTPTAEEWHRVLVAAQAHLVTTHGTVSEGSRARQSSVASSSATSDNMSRATLGFS